MSRSEEFSGGQGDGSFESIVSGFEPSQDTSDVLRAVEDAHDRIHRHAGHAHRHMGEATRAIHADDAESFVNAVSNAHPHMMAMDVINNQHNGLFLDDERDPNALWCKRCDKPLVSLPREEQ